MINIFQWYRFLQTFLIIVLSVALQGCAGKKQAETVIDWNSPRMHEIETEWQALRDAYDKDTGGKVRDGKSLYIEEIRSVDRLLRMRLPAQNLRQLAASAEMVPVLDDDRSPFVNDVLAFTVKAFVESGDRESLGVLLSKRCPSRIEWPQNIEYYLTYRGWRLKDPILILGEAYEKCQVPETRHTLAASLRRSFAGLGIRGKDDMEFVINAMRWYENEKGHLVVNSKYFLNELDSGAMFTVESYEINPDLYDNPPQEREPLFKTSTVLRGAPRNLGEEPDR